MLVPLRCAPCGAAGYALRVRCAALRCAALRCALRVCVALRVTRTFAPCAVALRCVA